MKTGNIEIRMQVLNQYGERIAIEQEIAEEDTDLSEIEVYHKAYLRFLSSAGFAVDSFNKVAILDENEYVETCCDEDCECCECEEDKEIEFKKLTDEVIKSLNRASSEFKLNKTIKFV